MPYLPSRFEADHDLCKFLTLQIEEFLLDDSFKCLRIQDFDLANGEFPNEDEHILDYLIRQNKYEIHDKILINQIVYRLIGDICYFVLEALEASRKKRLTVTFALLRKPFVSNLKILLRLFLTNDFLVKFNNEKKFEADRISEHHLKEILKLSEEVIFSKALKADDVYDFIFNPKEQNSLINISNQALHPSTTRNEKTMTGLQNLNFIFSIDDDIESQWEFLYSRLPFFLLYTLEILEFGIFKNNNIDIKVYEKRLNKRADFYK